MREWNPSNFHVKCLNTNLPVDCWTLKLQTLHSSKMLVTIFSSQSGITSQKTWIFNNSVVRTSNLAQVLKFHIYHIPTVLQHSFKSLGCYTVPQGQYFPNITKKQKLFTHEHRVTSQKTWIFSNCYVKTSHLAVLNQLHSTLFSEQLIIIQQVKQIPAFMEITHSSLVRNI